MSAFQEHRSAASAAETLRAMVLVRAPLDLVATASRFVLDELAHVEICARLAMELGGAAPLWHDPRKVIHEGDARLSPLLEAADLVVRNYCVEESIAAPMLRATHRAATVPLVKAVLGVLARDEATHAGLGWAFLDWAADALTEADRVFLAASAKEVIARFRSSFPDLALRPEQGPGPLAGLAPKDYRRHAERCLKLNVARPLALRGIDVDAATPEPPRRSPTE